MLIPPPAKRMVAPIQVIAVNDALASALAYAWRITPHPTIVLTVGGVVFVRCASGHTRGFRQYSAAELMRRLSLSAHSVEVVDHLFTPTAGGA